MVLKEGEKVLIITRRLFEGDARRHFVGEVKAATESLIRVEGYAFVCDLRSGKYAKIPEARVRVFGVGDSGIIVIVLPPKTALDHIRYAITDRRLVVTDDDSLTLDINEFNVD